MKLLTKVQIDGFRSIRSVEIEPLEIYFACGPQQFGEVERAKST